MMPPLDPADASAPPPRSTPAILVRVLVADPNPVVRVGLRAVLNAHPALAVVGGAADEEAVIARCAVLNPDVVVAATDLPGASGAELVTQVRRAAPGCRVLAVCGPGDGDTGRLLAAGCVGRRAAVGELVEAVRAVAAGDTYLDPALSKTAVPPTDTFDLSDREVQVVRLIAHGYSNKEIASNLRLSVKTIETYKTRSLEKLGLRGRVGIVRHAVRQGWLAGI